MLPHPRSAPVDVTIITPTGLHPDRSTYLEELHQDLQSISASWQWVLCIDGEHDRAVPTSLSDDPRVDVIRAGRKVGAASARNLALGLARGSWVTSVDDDDRLPEGSVDIRFVVGQETRVGWVGGLLADLRDGELSVWDCPARRGLQAPGDLWRTWESPDGTFPLGPTTLLVRTDLLRAAGGWQGLAQGEDFGMVMAVTSQTDGVMLDKVVYHYRKHEGQMMAAPGFFDLEPAIRAITFERGRLLSEQGLSAVPAQERRSDQQVEPVTL